MSPFVQQLIFNIIMLIRRTATKTQPKIASPQASPKHDIYHQIIKLTKQNQYLRTRIDCLTVELQRTMEAKDKYRHKYRSLKEDFEEKSSAWKGSVEGRHSIKCNQEGKIYRNPRFNETKKKIEYKDSTSARGPPSTRSEFNSIKPAMQHTLTAKIISDEDPYNLNCKKPPTAELKESMSLVSAEIETIKSLVSQVLDKISPLLGIMQTLSPSSLQSKIDRLEKTLLALQADITNSSLQKTKPVSQLPQPVRLCYESLELQRHPTIRQSRSRSDSSNIEILSEHRRSGTQPPKRDIKFNGAKHKLKVSEQYMHANVNNQGRNGCKSYRSKSSNQMSEGAEQRNQRSFIQRDVGLGDGPEAIQQWKMLKQIGRKLRNWKFELTDSERLDSEGKPFRHSP